MKLVAALLALLAFASGARGETATPRRARWRCARPTSPGPMARASATCRCAYWLACLRGDRQAADWLKRSRVRAK